MIKNRNKLFQCPLYIKREPIVVETAGPSVSAATSFVEKKIVHLSKLSTFGKLDKMRICKFRMIRWLNQRVSEIYQCRAESAQVDPPRYCWPVEATSGDFPISGLDSSLGECSSFQNILRCFVQREYILSFVPRCPQSSHPPHASPRG